MEANGFLGDRSGFFDGEAGGVVTGGSRELTSEDFTLLGDFIRGGELRIMVSLIRRDDSTSTMPDVSLEESRVW